MRRALAIRTAAIGPPILTAIAIGDVVSWCSVAAGPGMLRDVALIAAANPAKTDKLEQPQRWGQTIATLHGVGTHPCK